jgi:SAM-dependent methyltransferase
MNWQVKSLLQRGCSALPFGQEAAYYAIQRSLGRLRGNWDPRVLLGEAARLTRLLTAAAHPVRDAVLMEVGTGRGLDMPVGFYLCGAREIHTWDLYRLLKDHVITDLLAYIRGHENEIQALFIDVVEPSLLTERLAALRGVRNLREFWAVTGISYHAPGDAAQTSLPPASVDIQTSYTVFEHIPAEVLIAILREAARILKPSGAALHHIDLSDHFAHVDPSISMINFLRFESDEWRRYGSNPFAYHNRLRVSAYRDIYSQAGHEIVEWWPAVDSRSLRELANGFPLAAAYRDVAHEELAVSVLQVLSRPRV